MYSSERGSTLILVTWILLVMGVIAAFLVYRAEFEWAAASGLEKSMRLKETAESVLNEKLALLISDDTEEVDKPGDPWFGETGQFELDRDGYTIQIVIEDEGSKPNLNIIKGDSFREMDPEGKVSFDPVWDWRDTDSDPKEANGAELNYYQSLNPPYKPRDGFFSSIEELKAIKDSDQIYPLVAPVMTVYGKYNPNMLKKCDHVKDTFYALLLSYGFEKNWAERVALEFQNGPILNFTKIDDFLKLSAVTLDSREKMRPLFKFGEGSYNPNFISKVGLRVILRDIGRDPDLAVKIINTRKEQPFENLDSLKNILANNLPKGTSPIEIKDYFTLKSTIIRYRIWVTRDNLKYYLETVEERVFGKSKKQWKVHPLVWQSFVNDDVPEIPQELDIEEDLSSSNGGETK